MFLKLKRKHGGEFSLKTPICQKYFNCLIYKYVLSIIVPTLIAIKSEGSEKWLRFDSKLFDLNNNPSQAGQNIIWLDNIHG